MIINTNITFKKNALDVAVVQAMADAGMTFEERMKFGPAISQSLLSSSQQSGQFMTNLLNVHINSINFNDGVS